MKRWHSRSVFVLVVTAIYLYALPSATIFYAGTVFLHAGLGLLATIGILIFLFRGLSKEAALTRFGWIVFAAGALLGVALIRLGTPHRLKAWLYAHIALCTLAVILLAVSWMTKRGWVGARFLKQSAALALILTASAGIAAGSWYARNI